MNAPAPDDPLAAALLRPECYPHPVDHVALHETHISQVFLAGEYAYKVKKPVRLPFVDFSTLENRRRYCEEELRLNRRFAPGLYLEVVEIRGAAHAPRVGGPGALLEYALKMRRFSQDALASALLRRGALTPRLMADFAAYLAAFHSRLAATPNSAPFGTPDAVRQNALANFDEIADLVVAPADRDALAVVRDWTEREFRARHAALLERHTAGLVREVHGDLHLRNIVALDGALVPFDCIEFSAELRWNDVMSEVAFLVMDLMDHGAAPLAWTFLDAYLESSGDYRGLAVLRYYLVYRAMVRAKIHLLRAHQPGIDAVAQTRLMHAYRGYIELARQCAEAARPALILMHGYSGSGKSTLAAALVPALGAIRVRSDVERKRLAGLPALARSAAGLEHGLYAPESTRVTYARLYDAARAGAAAGCTVIVDATFLRRSHRAEVVAIARDLGVAVIAIDARAPLEVLRERIAARTADPSEATVQVLARQVATAEPIEASEGLTVVAVDTTAGVTPQAVARVVGRVTALIGDTRAGAPASGC